MRGDCGRISAQAGTYRGWQLGKVHQIAYIDESYLIGCPAWNKSKFAVRAPTT